MSSVTRHEPHSEHLVLDSHRSQDRRVAMATLAGTTIEWYDYFVYAQVAALVFGPQFFKAVPSNMQQIVSFSTIGISFLFRPLGAAIAGHFGDRLGRKRMLILTLMLMGLSTTLIGAIPSATSIGVAAPILLVLLRIIQGFSAGGEWGGAALMAVEHAPDDQRGKFGAFPQMGVPLGLLIATGVLAIMSTFTTDAQFASWGWRIPFLASLILIAFGLWIRLGVAESPVFQEISSDHEEAVMPLAQVFRHNGKQVLQAMFTFMGNNAAGYMVTGGFVLGYATKTLHMHKPTILNLVTLCAAVWLVTTWIGGVWSDRVGRRTVYLVGFVCQLLWVYPMFMLINTKSVLWVAVAMVGLTVGIGFTYGPQSALFAEMFPAKVRYSGAAISYAFGAILGGAFAPMIAQALVQHFHSTTSVSTYLAIVTVIALAATISIKDRTGQRIDAEARDIPGADALEATQA